MRTDLSGFAARRLAALVAVLLFCCAASGWASVLYVDAGASGDNSGASWADAYMDLQDALAAAEWGDEIWVAAGTYKPTSGTDKDISFIVPKGVEIYGGFSGVETGRDQRNWFANETVLSGDIGTEGVPSDNTHYLVRGGHRSILNGFTITDSSEYGMKNTNVSITVENCTISHNSTVGMFVSDDKGNYTPTVKNCVFLENGSSISSMGGGIQAPSCSPTIINCIFIRNSAYFGGAIYTNTGSPTITSCMFFSNTASHGGGGVYGGGGPMTGCVFIGNSAVDGGGTYNFYGSVDNTIFNGNSVSHDGGGMYSGASEVTNCVFSGNTASHDGGGIYLSYSTVTNCTFYGNSAWHSGGGMSKVSGTYTNCIFWQNSSADGLDEIDCMASSPILSYCMVRDSGGSGEYWDTRLGLDGGGNIANDPLFINAEDPIGPDKTWMTADDGLALGAGSPCIDVGDTTSAPETDILGKLRRDAADMGAYEYIAPNNGVVSWVFYR